MTALVILPTYNECTTLEGVVKEVLAQGPEWGILVVDDASPDGTGELADDLARKTGRVRVIHRPGKSGLGSAYREGFRHALCDAQIRFIVEMDADGSHDPAVLPQLLSTMMEVDVAVGSRYLGGIHVVNWPATRIALSYIANHYCRWLLGSAIHDWTSGFVGYRREVLEALSSRSTQASRAEGYAFQIEMKFECLRQGFRMKELEILFVDRLGGESKLSGWVVWEAIWAVWRLWGRRVGLVP